jgi:uncharacterized protein YutE (UPF0331/DUF86 family)
LPQNGRKRLVTDGDLVSKKLSLIEISVQELRTLARPEEIENDVREERFVERTLQIAVQAVIDVATHIVADERLGEPRTNREIFDLLKRYGWISPDLALSLQDMAGFRNILVHGYDAVDLTIVQRILANNLDDLLGFVSAIRAKL